MISVIIPVLNEEKVIADTLSQLALQTSSDFEVLVVDGGSTDNSYNIVKQNKNVKLLSAEKGRATQMNAGANKAVGDWLLFLHADTLLPKHAIQSIASLSADPEIKSGGFKHRFSGKDWRLTFISWLNNNRCSRNHVFYGDQAIFVKRTLFNTIGGFPIKNILEDVYFSIELKKHTRPILLDSHVITDSRKFTKMGIWKSLYRVANIQTRVKFGLPITSHYPFFTDAR